MNPPVSSAVQQFCFKHLIHFREQKLKIIFILGEKEIRFNNIGAVKLYFLSFFFFTGNDEDNVMSVVSCLQVVHRMKSECNLLMFLLLFFRNS